MLAIDWNTKSESLFMLDVISQKKSYFIQACASAKCSVETVNLQRLSAVESLLAALRELLKNWPVRLGRCRRQVIMALPVNQTLIKTIPILASFSERELREHLQAVVNQQTVTTAEDIFWDYRCLSKQTAHTEAVIVMAQKTTILTYQYLCAANRLTLRAIDVESYALARAMTICYPALVASAKTIGILLLRRELITLVAMHADQPVYARAAPIDIMDQEALGQVVLQLVKGVTFGIETEIFLAGEYAAVQDIAFLSQQLQLAVKIVARPMFVQVDKTAESFPFASCFLSFGLALWGSL